MNSGTVDPVATDPPFDKTKDFHATLDSLAAGASLQDRWSQERDVRESWTDQITDDHPRLAEAIESARHARSDGMGVFMFFMAVRLPEMRRVPGPTCSIFLRRDPAASHCPEAVMDAASGPGDFLNEIAWRYERGCRSKKFFSREHDVVILHGASPPRVFDADAVGLPRKETHMRAETDADGRAWQVKKDAKTGKTYRYAVDRGALCHDCWTGIQQLNGSEKERFGDPARKPLERCERMIRASSSEGGAACDPFAGCATTLVAAERPGRQWVGMDLRGNAKAVVLERLAREGVIGGDAGRRGPFDEDAHFVSEPPARTDDGGAAAL